MTNLLEHLQDTWQQWTTPEPGPANLNQDRAALPAAPELSEELEKTPWVTTLLGEPTGDPEPNENAVGDDTGQNTAVPGESIDSFLRNSRGSRSAPAEQQAQRSKARIVSSVLDDAVDTVDRPVADAGEGIHQGQAAQSTGDTPPPISLGLYRKMSMGGLLQHVSEDGGSAVRRGSAVRTMQGPGKKSSRRLLLWLHPDGRPRGVLDVLVSILVMYSVYSVPILIAFDISYKDVRAASAGGGVGVARSTHFHAQPRTLIHYRSTPHYAHSHTNMNLHSTPSLLAFESWVRLTWGGGLEQCLGSVLVNGGCGAGLWVGSR